MWTSHTHEFCYSSQWTSDSPARTGMATTSSMGWPDVTPVTGSKVRTNVAVEWTRRKGIDGGEAPPAWIPRQLLFTVAAAAIPLPAAPPPLRTGTPLRQLLFIVAAAAIPLPAAVPPRHGSSIVAPPSRSPILPRLLRRAASAPFLLRRAFHRRRPDPPPIRHRLGPPPATTRDLRSPSPEASVRLCSGPTPATARGLHPPPLGASARHRQGPPPAFARACRPPPPGPYCVWFAGRWGRR
uniref:Uncharacterized protein n=1 Tax=Aegilops tauschii subsp. strangulata TaxID=200361 RepID=A0A453SLX7_AEGTS